MDYARSLQDQFGQENLCFGCGSANPKGLRLKSYLRGDGLVVATFQPEPHHAAFTGVLNGGIIGTLLDCHGVWTSAAALMRERGEPRPPPVVTASFTIDLKRPSDPARPVHLQAYATRIDGDRVLVEGTLESNGKVGAKLTGTFVAVKPDHPAYHRW